jgi:23S rRNA (uracil1939-C5)-methyltransferase
VAAHSHTVTLNTLTYGGNALGRLDDGRAVFVPFGLPGEVVHIRLVQEKPGFARGELVEVVEPAAQRIQPRCKHYGICGGCQYQHMPYEMQLAAKTAILRDQLQRIGKIPDPPIQPPVASEHPWNYRNQVQFHLTDAGRVGYVSASAVPGMRRGVLAIDECHLPEAGINGLWPQLDFEPGSGIQRVSIRAGANDDLLLGLESASDELPELEVEADISVAHVFGGKSVVMAGRDYITLRVLERDFRISAASFFQVNTGVAEKMVQSILARLPDSPGTVLDAYCGVGLFSAFLAHRCRRLIGIESSPDACADFALNLDEFDNVELYEDLAERVLPALKIEPDVVLVDPPRAGLQLEARNALAGMKPRALFYISCDPSTLARDAAQLIEAGYRLMAVTPFDLFPQTYHIESISLFAR